MRGLEHIADMTHDTGTRLEQDTGQVLVVESSPNLKKMNLSRSILRRKTILRPRVARDGHERVDLPIQLRLSGNDIRTSWTEAQRPEHLRGLVDGLGHLEGDIEEGLHRHAPRHHLVQRQLLVSP